MNRRAFLSALAGGSTAGAGLLSTGALDSPRSSEVGRVSAASTATTALDGRPFRELRVDRLPESFPLDPTATFLGRPAETALPRVRVSLRNDGALAKTVRTATRGLPFPGGEATNAAGDGLALAPAPVDGTVAGDAGCRGGAPDRSDDPEERQIAGGAALSKTYAVLNAPSNESCYPAGEYRFSGTYTVNPGPFATSVVEWGFALVV